MSNHPEEAGEVPGTVDVARLASNDGLFEFLFIRRSVAGGEDMVIEVNRRGIHVDGKVWCVFRRT